MRAELIASEMASAVRFLGGGGSAKEQITKAARAARLPLTVIERLRWRKIKRVPADIADAIREAVQTHNDGSLARAEHELFLAKQKNALLLQELAAVDPSMARRAVVEPWGSHAGQGR